MKTYLLRLASFLALMCPAIAVQTPVGFNISLQEPAQVQVPSSTYAAASFQTGTWNRLEASNIAVPLVDVNNTPTAVTIEASGVMGPYPQMDIPTTFGDDELLLDGGFSIGDPGGGCDISGLAPGDYAMFSYILNDNWSVGARLSVHGISIDFPINSGFGGTFVEGGSHLVHHFTVQPGQVVRVGASVYLGEHSVRIQGFQVVPIEALHRIQFCDSQVNSTGSMANMVFGGSSSVQADDLQLGASNLPLNQFGYFLVSWDPGIGIIPPGSQGNLCVSGNIGRHNRAGEVLFSGATGSVLMDVELTDIPQPTGSVSILPGESWHWQFWYRDTNPSNTSNFSDAYRIGFLQ